MSIRNTHERLVDWDCATGNRNGLSWEIRGDRVVDPYTINGEVLVRLIEDAEKWRELGKPSSIMPLPKMTTEPGMESVIHRLLDRIDKLEGIIQRGGP